ncbi:MAG: Ig-like domain-containing protein [Treponema sp.]|nr:Ig-like domain-containing protein [Treponema sp.]
MSKFCKSFILIISFISSGCAIIRFSDLETKISINSNDTYYKEQTIKIGFSKTVNHSCVEKLIQLKENNYTLPLHFDWEDNSLIITPDSPFISDQHYSLLIQGRIITESEGSYDIYEHRSFIFKNNDISFELLQYEFPSKVNDTQEIKLAFSKPVSQSDFENKFSISPFIQTVKYYSQDYKTVTIKPVNQWASNYWYTVTYCNGISQDNSLLKNDFTQHFEYFTEESDFKLLNYGTGSYDKTTKKLTWSNSISYNENCESVIEDVKKDDFLIFEFNRKLNTDYFTKIINCLQDVNYYYTNEFLIVEMVSNKLQDFEIKILSSLTDIDKSKLGNDINFRIKVCSNYNTITKLLINSQVIENPEDSDSLYDIQTAQDNQTISILAYFDTPVDDEFKSKILSAVNLSPVFPNSLLVPKLMEIKFDSTRTILSLLYSGCTKKDSDRQYYKLTFNNSRLNLKEELCVNFCF